MLKNKRTAAILLSAAVGFSSIFSGSAVTFAEEMQITSEEKGSGYLSDSGLSYQVLEAGTIEITGCDTSVSSVIIPSQIDGKDVTSI